MQLGDQNILFFTRTMALGGTENVILQLCEVFRPLAAKIVVCSCGGVNESKLAEMGIRHYQIPDIENKSPGVMISTLRRVRKIIRDEQISVIHTHHRMAAFYCQLLGIKKHIQLINTSHTSFYDKKALTQFAFRGFHLIACGEGVKKSLTESLGFPADRVTVICNGVKKTESPLEEIPEIRAAREKQHHVFAVIGRLSREKGVDYLIRALSMLKNTHATCIVAGSGPEEAALRELAGKNRTGPDVVFLGYREDVSNIIRQVDFIVQPSLQEGLPLVPIEAFAAGKTVIGTRIDGTSEIIENERNGLLVPAASESELAKAIDCMCTADRTAFEQHAAETFRSRYSFEVFAGSYIRYYENL